MLDASNQGDQIDRHAKPVVVPNVDNKSNSSAENSNRTTDVDDCLHLDSLL